MLVLIFFSSSIYGEEFFAVEEAEGFYGLETIVEEIDLFIEDISQEPEEIDLFLSEPFTQSNLQTLRQTLEELSNLVALQYDFYRLGLAVTYVSEHNRFNRRNLEYKLRKITPQSTYGLAGLLIMSDMLYISSQLPSLKLETYLAVPLEIESRKQSKRDIIKTMSHIDDFLNEQLQLYNQYIESFESYINSNSSSLVTKSSGDFFRTISNRRARVLSDLKQQVYQAQLMACQLEKILKRNRKTYNYLKQNFSELEYVQFARSAANIRRSFYIFKNIYLKFRIFSEKMVSRQINLANQDWETLEAIAMSHDMNVHHIIYGLNNYPKRDLNTKESEIIIYLSIFKNMFKKINTTSPLFTEVCTDLSREFKSSIIRKNEQMKDNWR